VQSYRTTLTIYLKPQLFVFRHATCSYIWGRAPRSAAVRENPAAVLEGARVQNSPGREVAPRQLQAGVLAQTARVRTLGSAHKIDVYTS
jgi:hypothetical protein